MSNEETEVSPGQVWQGRSKRTKGRRLYVESIKAGKAVCWPWFSNMQPGKRTRKSELTPVLLKRDFTLTTL
jgi:hypothetical protein